MYSLGDEFLSTYIMHAGITSFWLVMEKVDLPPELVYAPRLLLVANVGVLLNDSLVDLLLKVIQIHHRAVLAQGLAKLRYKPRT